MTQVTRFLDSDEQTELEDVKIGYVRRGGRRRGRRRGEGGEGGGDEGGRWREGRRGWEGDRGERGEEREMEGYMEGGSIDMCRW